MVLFATFMCVSAYLLWLVNEIVPTPYMDEIFHIPQAQEYCRGNFHHWDKKITTLPGLYVVSQALLYPFKFLQYFEFNCTTVMLRASNFIFMIGNIWVLKRLLISINKSVILQSDQGENEKKDVHLAQYIELEALILSLFPLLYFFNFLYYTDAGSTFFVLISYYYTLEKYYKIASIMSFVAITFRQTNSVWLIFNAGVAIYSLLQEKYFATQPKNLFDECIMFVQHLFQNIFDVITIAWSYACVAITFFAFVIINNGIVVGDRSSHEATFNASQMNYFFLFVGVFASFKLVNFLSKTEIKSFISFYCSFANLIHLLIVFVLVIIGVKYSTHVHRYTLADNRHYTFYVWRRLIDRTWYARYALIPIYLCCYMVMMYRLASRVKKLWILFFFCCTFIVLVPQKLLEFRYFIIPYLLYRLHIKQSNIYELTVELIFYVTINIVTFYLFLYSPFKWESESAIQRFMW